MSSFIKNVGFASEGVRYFFASERNGRIQLVMGFLVIALGIAVGLSRIDWCIILLCIALVLGLEMMNTALERVCEMLTTEIHPMIKIIKDVAAGAVLWVSVISAVVGVIISFPYLKSLIDA
jgi:diacylglycerol kinase